MVVTGALLLLDDFIPGDRMIENQARAVNV